MSRFLRCLLALVVLACFTGPATGDVIELVDGTKLDAKVLKDDGAFVTVKTLKSVQKLAAEKIKSRTPGESDVEKYEKLQVAAAAEPVTAAALWNLYEFQRDHASELPPETAKDNQRLLPRILKKAPEHAGARDANGDVQFNGQWVKKTDLPRLEAEAAREKLRLEWEQRLRVPVQICEADHFLLVDNTGDKDLVGRGKQLDKAWDSLTQALGIEQLWKDKCVVMTIKDYDPYCKVVDDFAAFAALNPTVVAGAKDRSTGGLWRQRPYAFQIRWPSSGTEGMWSAIIHNCSHITIWTLWGKNTPPPAWMEEGMGAWVETTVTGQQVSFCVGESAKPKEEKGGTTDKKQKKKDPKKNAQSLREASNEYKERCKQAIEDDSFPPMRQFLKYRMGDIGPPEEGATLGLVTWLMLQDAEKFKTLVAALAKGGKKTDDEYWRDVYGFQVIEDMETKWRGWVAGEW